MLGSRELTASPERTSCMTSNLNSFIRLPVAAALGMTLLLGACGGTADADAVATDPDNGESNVPSEHESVAVGEASSFETPVLDQELTFARAVEPFENAVAAVIDGDMINVVDMVAGEVVASHPTSFDPFRADARTSGGAIYITDESRPGSRQLMRIDAGGTETVNFEAVGWVDHRIVTEGHALHIRSNDEPRATFMAIGEDGQIDQYNFGSSLFIEASGDTIVATAEDFTGEVWILDNDMTVLDSANVGEVRNRPSLIAENTLRISRGGTARLVDLDTWESSVQASDFTRTDTGEIRQFGDGWVAELSDAEFSINGPDGQVVANPMTEPISGFQLLVHPDNGTALVALRTCTNRDGSICDSGDGSGSTEDEAGDEEYVPPAFVEVFLLDMAATELSSVAIDDQTSLAALAVDSGWFVASVDETTTTIWSISNDGAAENLAEIESVGQDFAQNFVVPLTPNGLALVDRDVTDMYLLTEDGLEVVSGTALDSDEDWREWKGRFAFL